MIEHFVERPHPASTRTEPDLDRSQGVSSRSSEDGGQALLDDWHVLARSQDLPPQTLLPRRLLETNLVLWRDSSNQIRAWEDRCPHRGTLLSTGTLSSDRVVCPYHGLTFNSEGHCVEIPAHPGYPIPSAACVQTYQVQECYDLIFVSLGHPTQDVPQFPEWQDPTYRRFLCGPFHCHTSGGRAIENFFDVAHFPFVHAGVLGDPKHPVPNEYEVSRQANGITIHNVQFWQPDPDGTGNAQLITNTYRIFRPFTVYFSKESRNQRLTIFFNVTPVTEEEVICWMWIAMNYGHDRSEAELRAFQETVIAQDLQILELQRPRRLPLNVQTEFHLPSDRASLTYRKWLRELGITFGTC
ncbi:MAG: aromatic ring-hydroxylating dioxygenase subunit alpha [Kovacikia sp.]